ncbi:uncharacterized protein LOC127244943 isoform X2 [Andrographis paniculata]|uniref:uncharacterized protein LOC127244943 isoform X2 n=1 Tax=Andrographis paniculata TaxID=175694 RepID=UPI0021E8C83D|nr:uncharacterized protein LOC127244943 isoform X2 [Andrographis paniculata]
MADSGEVEEAGFWLPAEFFDDFVTGKDNLLNNKETDSGDGLCFPADFPYESETPACAHFGKRQVMSTSPQSTLLHGGIGSSVRSAGGSSNGSPDGVYSPPTTPLGAAEYDAIGDLIHLAAGQVAKLKLNGDDGALAARRNPNQLPVNYGQSAFQNIHQQQYYIMKQEKENGRAWYQSQMTRGGWDVVQTHTRIHTHNPTRMAAAKRARSGTGVFLPRNNDNTTSNGFFSSRKKTGSTYFPERNATGDLLSNKFNGTLGFVQPQFQPPPPYNNSNNNNNNNNNPPKFSYNRGRGRGSFLSNYELDLFLARRNAALMILQQQRRPSFQSPSPMAGIYLPQDWTY